MQKSISNIPFRDTAEQHEKLVAVIESLKGQKGAVMPALHKAQEIYGYLPIEVQKQIADFLPESLTVVQTAAFYLEVIPRIINKGQGIRDICKVLGIEPAEVVSFGDAANDIPMLEAAGMGVAMGNAQEAVKQVADMVTLSNNEDGIAAALEKLL